MINLFAETTPIMALTENSGEGGVSSNSQSTYTTPNSLTAGDIESNKEMFSALTESTEHFRRPLLLWVTNYMNTPNVKWSRLIS